MPIDETPLEKFLAQLSASARDGSLVKITLGKSRAADQSLQNIFVRPVLIGGEKQLSFLWHYDRRDITKNHAPTEAVALIAGMLGSDFLSAHLFTATTTWQLEYNKKGVARLSTGKPVAESADASHDRKKSRLLPEESQAWLQALGVTTSAGLVREGMADKHRQLHKFVEILSHLTPEVDLPASRPIEIADMGCGKGYLTFATHDYFNRVAGRPANVVGIDVRAELMEKCHEVAQDAGCTRLNFQTASIESAKFPVLDVLIALHACDTATDDAIMQGLQGGASLIVVAPCCQKELRPQLHAAAVLAPALRHGIFQERHAEFVTDALRALLLEWAGYDTKVFEFISTEHTAKNVMIAATKKRGAARTDVAAVKVRALAEFYGIKTHALARQLGFVL